MHGVKFLFLLALLGAFLCALLPGSSLMGVVPLGGYLVHLVTFVVLGFLVDISYGAAPVVVKVTFLGALGALIEVAQYFLPYRSSSLVDLTVDIGGILTYFLLVQRFVAPLLFGFSPCPAVERGAFVSPNKLSKSP